jgi:hypothetical protein
VIQLEVDLDPWDFETKSPSLTHEDVVIGVYTGGKKTYKQTERDRRERDSDRRYYKEF